MSAFAARKAKRPLATENPFAGGTDGQNLTQVSEDHGKNQISYDDEPPQKRQKTAAKLQTVEDKLFPPLAPIVRLPPSCRVGPRTPITVKLPHRLQEISEGPCSTTVESTSKSPGPQSSESEKLEPETRGGAASNGRNDETDSDYSFEREESEPRVLRSSSFGIKHLSNFIPSVNNILYDCDTEWNIRLGENEHLTLVGQYDIWVRRGAVAILGAVLRRSSRLYRVYAPSTHSLAPIRPLKDPYGPPHQATEITIIACDSGIRSLKENSVLFRRIWNHKHVPEKGVTLTADLTKRSFIYLKSSADDLHRRPLRLVAPYHDRQILITRLLTEKRSLPPRIMICGPKDSGKSTFGRLLINAMVSRPDSVSPAGGLTQTDGVAFLDLDPGQPEYSPPGELSLIHLRSSNLGPPYTHPVVVANSGNCLVRAHHLGFLSPKNDPEHYVRCAQDLFDRYRDMLARFPSCPLIINCAGWVQGTGLDVLLDLVKMIQSGDIVYTSTRGPRDVVDAISEAARRARSPLHFISSQDFAIATRTSADLRMMQTLSYFHLDEPEEGNLRWDSTPMSDRVPLVVHWAGDKQAIFAVMVLDDAFNPETMTAILNGNTVGLVVVEDVQSFLCPTEQGESNGAEDRQLALTVEDTNMENEDKKVMRRSGRSSRAASTSQSDIGQDDPTDAEMAMTLANRHGPREGLPTGRGQATAKHEHPSTARSSEDIPYIADGKQFASPLDPTKSFSLGQALISCMDHNEKCFHLITPIAPAVFSAVHQQGKKIVLVRGTLATPRWVAREDWEKGAALRRKLRKEDPETADRFDAQDAIEWAEGRPHVSALEDRVKSVSAKVWKVRRDIKPTRGSGDDTD